MREPQVVRIPSVRKISFSASGMPVNISASPAAKRRSAASASAIACSGVMVMNEPICGSTASMRASMALVASTAETCLDSIIACSSCMVRSKSSIHDSMVSRLSGLSLFQYLWYAIKTGHLVRCVGQGLFYADRRIGLVWPEGILHRNGMRGGQNAIGIKFLEFLDISEDGVHLSGKERLFSIAQVQARQCRNIFNIANGYL